MKKYPMLDVFRLLCACLVVVIHLDAGNTAFGSMLISCFSCQAVPFFFIASGFFFVRNLEKAPNTKAYILKFFKNQLFFYFLWSLILLPQSIATYVQLYPNQSVLYLVLVLIRRTLLAGTAQFWFLLALAVTALIAGFCLLHNRRKLLFTIAAIGFLLGILYSLQIQTPPFSLYNRLVYALFSWQNNFLMSGLPFFCIGIFLSDHSAKITATRTGAYLLPYGLVCLASLILFSAACAQGWNPERIMFLYPFQATLLFLIGLSTKDIPPIRTISPFCRNASVAVYCLHNLAIEYCLGDLIPWSEYGLINHLVVISACILIYILAAALKLKPLYRLITLK